MFVYNNMVHICFHLMIIPSTLSRTPYVITICVLENVRDLKIHVTLNGDILPPKTFHTPVALIVGLI